MFADFITAYCSNIFAVYQIYHYGDRISLSFMNNGCCTKRTPTSGYARASCLVGMIYLKFSPLARFTLWTPSQYDTP